MTAIKDTHVRGFEARSNFASLHLMAADYFAHEMCALVCRYPPSKAIFARPEYYHVWYSAVAFSVMAIEASIYDIMMSGERGEVPLAGRTFLQDDFKRLVLERYCLVHRALRNGQKMPAGREPVQAARGLVKLRDEIVHYKSENRSGAEISNRLEKLIGLRFERNPYCCGDIFFPEQCVCVSGAQWAVSTSRKFIVNFSEITGVRLMVEREEA